MNDGFLKPPGFGIWLAFTSGTALVMSMFLGPTVAAIGEWVALLCSIIAVGIVLRWLGRCVGYWIGYVATEFATGYSQAREEARRARGGN
jgi:hypothetical protein